MEYQILNPGDPDYPRRLAARMGPDAPTLYARGALDHLRRWTMAFLTSDIEPNTGAAWKLFFPVLEFEMNAIGPWQAVSEGVFMRSALEKPWISLTLFTARGIEIESHETFLAERHRPPAEQFPQRPEYERRAAEGELLLLSASPPKHRRQTRAVVLDRNWIVCNLADAVFLGCVSRIARSWSMKKGRLTGKRTKTYMLAKRLVGSGIPVFTVEHPENRDLINLGIEACTDKTVAAMLESLGARRGSAPPRPARRSPKGEGGKPAFPAKALESPPAAKAAPKQFNLFDPPAKP